MFTFSKRSAFLFLVGLVIVSLFFSPFLLSVSFLLLGGLSVVDWQRRDPAQPLVHFDRAALGRIRNVQRYPTYLALMGLFGIVLLSVWGMTDVDYWFDRLRIRLPFLLLPLAFLGLPTLRQEDIDRILYFLLALSLVTAIGVVVNYTLHADAIIQDIKRGQPIPTPRNHIRYSLLIVLAIIGGIHLSWRRAVVGLSQDRWLVPLVTCLLFGFLHFLSVRTGLVAMYATLVVLVAALIWQQKRYMLGGAILALLVALPFVAYHTVPSFRAKMAYVDYDYWKHQRGEGSEYADSGRLVSLQVGMEIVAEHFWLGTGAGGLRPMVQKKFAEGHPSYVYPLMPHNQYLYVMAATGLVGVVLFLIAFYFPLFYRRRYRYLPLLGLYTVLATTFLIEHTIENSVGAGYAAFFILLFLQHLRAKENDSATAATD